DHDPEAGAQPDRPPHRGRHRADWHRARRHPPGRARQPRRRRRGVHPQAHRHPAQARARLAGRAALQRVPAGLGPGHGRPQRLEDPRQHGDRPQHPPRPVGLDAR
ncbi:MAG: Linoleoyl-CoA desaturase, partial [uncultured Nocardioides sp.]